MNLRCMNNLKRTSKVHRKVKLLAEELYRKGYISVNLKSYLVPKLPKPGKLKGNPKVHKAGNPYRCIVSCIGTATENMAEVAEKELETYMTTSPSYIKDTTDFLNKVQEIGEVTDQTILFSMDVVKLYPSIPRKEEIEACKEALNLRSNPSIPTEAVIDMIKLVLEINIFYFNNKHYK